MATVLLNKDLNEKSVGFDAFFILFIMWIVGNNNWVIINKKMPLAFFYSVFFNSSLIFDNELVNSLILP